MTRRPGREGAVRSPAAATLLTLAVVAPLLVTSALVVVEALSDSQREEFESHAVAEARSVLVAVPDDVDGPTGDALGRALRRPDRLEVVLVDADGAVSRSSRDVDLGDVPDHVRTSDGVVAGATTTVDDERFFVAGGSTGSGPVAVFLFFSERPLEQEESRATVAVTIGTATLLLLTACGGWLRSHHRTRALSRRRTRERAYTAHLAHELRTPVGALVTAASLIDESQLRRAPEPLRAPVEVMQTQVRRLRLIVEGLLELSRLEAGQVELRLEPVDVGQVLRETLESYGWDDVHIEVTGTTIAHADRQGLARIVLNLVANARRHADGPVEVIVAGSPRSIVLEVSDDGPGIEPHLVAALTQPGRPTTHRPHAGQPSPGLGLLITRAHADLLGARIDVDTGPDVGTTVRVHLRPSPDPVDPRPPAGHGDAGMRSRARC